jgi:hypothetical protein
MDIRKQLIILILVFLCAPVSAQKKEKLITLKFTNIPLSEAMPKVEKQSGYTFFYESQQIDIKQKVSLNVKNETINKTIAALLKGTNVKFEIDATHIILYTGKNNKAISGQPQNISGTVIDESGEPIIGANVMVEGTSTGVITDLDGKYTINAPAGSNLKISYIGYVTQTVKAGRNSTVKLVEDSKTLAEVVVIGYGTQRKSELTVLKSEEEPVEPEQTLTITVTTTVNEATGELTLGTNIVTSDGLPIKRTEPLVIDIVTKDGDTPIEYFIPSSITILDFTNNVNSFTVERNTDVSVSDDIIVSIEFSSEEGIVIEGTNPTIIIPKDEVVVPDEPQEINVTFNVTKNVAIKEENYEILATVSTSDGKPFQSVGEEQLKVEFIYSDPDSQSHINEVYTLPITKNTSNQSSAVLSIYRNNKLSFDNKTFEILISSEIPGINVTDGRIELTIVQD